MKTVIGIVGEKGSGKGTFVHILQALSNKFVDSVKSSGLLAETLTMWDIPLTRSNLQQLAIIMKGKYGDTSLSHAIEKRIQDSKHSIIVYDGIRWQEDVDMLRKFPKSILIYVTAPAEVRYKRLLARKEKVGEGEATFEQFMTEEQVPTETQIPAIATQADVKIENIGTKEELEDKVKEFYSTITN
jgi:dephospho-CoA kinase